MKYSGSFENIYLFQLLVTGGGGLLAQLLPDCLAPALTPMDVRPLTSGSVLSLDHSPQWSVRGHRHSQIEIYPDIM